MSQTQNKQIPEFNLNKEINDFLDTTNLGRESRIRVKGFIIDKRNELILEFEKMVNNLSEPYIRYPPKDSDFIVEVSKLKKQLNKLKEI